MEQLGGCKQTSFTKSTSEFVISEQICNKKFTQEQKEILSDRMKMGSVSEEDSKNFDVNAQSFVPGQDTK